MWRYVATAVVALLLLALALRWRADAGGAEPLVVPGGSAPAVRVAKGPDGRVFTVTHAFRGSVSRAAIVYELDGEDRTAAVETDCRRSLAQGASVTDDGYATTVELTGAVPEGASNVRLVLESETGTRVHRIDP
jgi:hypothetical protein